MKRLISAVVIVASGFYAVMDRVAAATTDRPSNDGRGFTEPDSDYKAIFDQSGNKVGKSIYYTTPSPVNTNTERMMG